MGFLPRINLPGIINDIIGTLLSSADTATSFIGRQFESLYSAIRGWLWAPLKWAINNALGGLDDLVDAIIELPADILTLLGKLDNLILEGVGLTWSILKSLILENLLDLLEEAWELIEGWVDEHWDDE